MPRIRTIGGTGVGASTSTATFTAANVEWGPNFGSTRALAQEAQMQSSNAANVTQALTKDQVFRPVSYAGSYPIISESCIRADNLLDVPVDLFTQEQNLSRSNIANTSAGLTHEGSVSVDNTLEATTLSMLSEGALRLLSQTAAWPIILEHFHGLKEVVYVNFQPIHEAGMISGAFEAVFPVSGVWVVPAGVTTYTGFVWGGGGGGGNGGAVNGGNGGGGGAFALATGLTATPGTTVTVSLSIGTTGTGADSFIDSTLSVMAKGGNRGANNGSGGGGGGSSAASIGTLKFGGGNGFANSGAQGGGGGGGAGTSANGGNAGSTAGGLGGGDFGGNGGRGGNAAGIGGNGVVRGGGGGGGGNASSGGVSARGAGHIVFPAV